MMTMMVKLKKMIIDGVLKKVTPLKVKMMMMMMKWMMTLFIPLLNNEALNFFLEQ